MKQTLKNNKPQSKKRLIMIARNIICVILIILGGVITSYIIGISTKIE